MPVSTQFYLMPCAPESGVHVQQPGLLRRGSTNHLHPKASSRALGVLILCHKPLSHALPLKAFFTIVNSECQLEYRRGSLSFLSQSVEKVIYFPIFKM